MRSHQLVGNRLRPVPFTKLAQLSTEQKELILRRGYGYGLLQKVSDDTGFSYMGINKTFWGEVKNPHPDIELALLTEINQTIERVCEEQRPNAALLANLTNGSEARQ